MNVLPHCPPLIFFENESNNIYCQNINKLLLTISEAASEGETGKLGRAFWDGTQMVQVILRRERLLCEYRRA